MTAKGQSRSKPVTATTEPVADTELDPTWTWVTLAEASEQAGVSVSWLRKAYARGDFPTLDVPGPKGPRKAVPLGAVLEAAARFQATRPTTPATATPGTDMVPVSMYTALVDRVADAERARGRLDEVEQDRDRLRHLHLEAVREVEALRAQLATVTAPISDSPPARRSLFRRAER